MFSMGVYRAFWEDQYPKLRAARKHFQDHEKGEMLSRVGHTL